MTLLEFLKATDRQTQDKAFAELKNVVYPICYRRLAYYFPGWVDEAVMEAMDKVYRQIDEITTDEKLETIAKRTAMNCAVSLWRELTAKKRELNQGPSLDQLQESYGEKYQSVDRPLKSGVEDENDAPCMPPATTNCLSNLELADIRNILEKLQENLKAEHKMVLKLLLRGMSNEEIAQELGHPVSTVRVYAKRGLDAMREQRTKYPKLTEEALKYIVSVLL